MDLEGETFDLSGSLLKVAAVVTAEGYPTYELDWEIFKGVQFLLNFNYTLQKVNNWRELEEKILKGEADFTVSTSANTPIYYQMFDFTMTSYTSSFAAIFRKPTFRTDSLALFRPFRWSLWFAICIWCACLYNCLRASAHLSRLLMDKVVDEGVHSWILPVALLCGKSLPCSVLPRAAWYRVIVYTGAVSGLVLNAAFSGVLLSFLFVSKEGSSLSQLKSLGVVEFAIHPENVPLFDHKVQGGVPSEFSLMYSNTKKVHSAVDGPISKEKILVGAWVGLLGEFGAYDAVNRYAPADRCAVNVALLPMANQQWGCLTPKNSKYKRPINIALLKTRESGLLNLWAKRFAPRRLSCQSNGRYEPVPFESIYLANSLFCLAALGSVIVLFIELFSWYHACHLLPNGL